MTSSERTIMQNRIRIICRTLFTACIVLVLPGAVVGLLDAKELASLKPGDIVFQTNFDTPQQRTAWSRASFAKWETGYQETTSLCITVPVTRAQDGNMIHLPLDLTRYRGCRLLLECVAKAENVTKPPQSYLGVKFMLHYGSSEKFCNTTSEEDAAH